MSVPFYDYIATAIKGSPALTDEEVSSAVSLNDKKVLYAYALRCAAFGAIYCRQSAPDIDPGDWCDAIQECMLHFEGILSKWKPERGTLFRYLTYCFKALMLGYVRTLSMGGTGTNRTAAQFTVSLDAMQYVDMPDSTGFSEEVEHYENLTNDENAPFGLRDPLIEAIALDDVKNAIIYMGFNGRRVGASNGEGLVRDKTYAKSLSRKRSPALDF